MDTSGTSLANPPESLSTPPEVVSTSLEIRLANIERLVEGLAHRLEQTNQATIQRNLFLWIVATHSFISVFCTLYAENLLYGVAVGATTTLAVWHAISLRSFWGRWTRSIIAAASVLTPFCIATSSKIDQLGYLVGIVLLYFGGVATVTRLFATYSQTWLWAPDLPPPSPRPVSIKALMMISVAVACLFAIVRAISLAMVNSDPTSANYAGAILLYGGIAGFLLNGFLYFYTRFSCWKRQALGVLALFSVSLIVNTSGMPIAATLLNGDGISGMNDWQSIQRLLPSFFLFTLCGIGSPLITFYVLLQHGQKFVRLNETLSNP